MDDTVPKEDLPPDFNKIDLSQLQGFSFGTQWTQDKSSPAGAREKRPDREARRPGPGDGGVDRRDRRSFRRPDGPAGAHAPDSAADPRRGPDSGPGMRPRPQGDSPRRYAPQDSPRRGPSEMPRIPYDSPHFTVSFYPDDATFDALVKTVRASCRTIELFEIARTILDKPERFTLHITRRSPADAGASAAPAPASAPNPAPLYLSVPDNLPFDSEEAAVAHVVGNHLNRFFDAVEAEIEPPKGNFQVVNRCGVTGELLGPPNYHRYTQIIQQHHAAKVARMPFETFKSRIETVRDPEVIAQWLEKMKKVTRYVWKDPAAAVVSAKVAAPEKAEPAPATEAAISAEPAAAPEPPAAPAASAETVETPAAVPAPEPVAAPAAAEPAESAKLPSFDSLEEARSYLLTNARDRVIRPVTNVRVAGRDADKLANGEILRAAEGALERQRRFPLETANGLRGRLRREHFTIFKKGAKGVSYVCAVKRKFRIPGQAFSDNIGSLIAFIEEHPLVKAGDLAKGLLKIAEPGPEGVVPDQRERIARLQGDLHWLVREGYVTEFIDGGLYAPAPLPEARKREAEAAENDPENFPEAPPAPPPTEQPAEPVSLESSAAPVSPEPETAAPAASPEPEPAVPLAAAEPESAPPEH